MCPIFMWQSIDALGRRDFYENFIIEMSSQVDIIFSFHISN